MRGHIDTGTLAAFREGLLSRRRTARVTAHLSGCPQCAGTDTRLAGVTTILASSAVPPMPPGLAGRIGAALAAEAASRTAAEAKSAPGTRDGIKAARSQLTGHTDGAGQVPVGGGPSAEPPPAPGGTRRRPRRSRSWVTLRVAAVTAAIAVIAGGGYGVAQLLPEGATSGGTSSSASAPRHKAAGSPGAEGAGSRLAPSAGSLGSLTVVSSGTNYQPQQLGSQAKLVLAHFGQPGPRGEATTKSAAPRPFGNFVNLPACVERVSGGRIPRLVDLATYQGRQAAVIMLPAGQNRLRVLVVGTGCSATANDVLARTSVQGTG